MYFWASSPISWSSSSFRWYGRWNCTSKTGTPWRATGLRNLKNISGASAVFAWQHGSLAAPTAAPRWLAQIQAGCWSRIGGTVFLLVISEKNTSFPIWLYCWQLTWQLNCRPLTWRLNCWELTWQLNCWQLTWRLWTAGSWLGGCELLGADLAAELLAVDLAAVNCWEITWRLNCWQLTWWLNCWELTWRLNCWQQTWWLNWVFCVTCYRSYSVPWVLKQVEAPAKQDHFRWCSASKAVNVKTFTASTLFPPSNGKVPNYECWPLSCWLQGTRPFHFQLDEISCAAWFFLLCFRVDLTVSVRCNEAYSCVVVVFFGGKVLAQHQQNSLCHCLLQTKKPLKQLKKPLNHQLSYWVTEEKWGVQQRLDDRFSVGQIWRWHWHLRVWQPSVTFVLQTVLCQSGNRSGEQKRKQVISKKAVGQSSGHFKCHFGPQY